MANSNEKINASVAHEIRIDEEQEPKTTSLPTDGSLDSRKSELETPLKPWEEPGRRGDIRRSWRSIQRYIWDDPDKSDKEKKFLFKLDLFLLSYGCLGYFCKNLDQANLNNAYVSGMQEAIGMKGSDLTYSKNIFTAGYVISQLPAVMIVSHIRPSYFIPTLEVLWAIFTFSSAAVKSVKHLYALRFLIGLCEGAFFPTMIYVIGAWYTKSERAKRVTIFYSTANLASMFSGYLQAAAYDNLDGKLGHQGWQWLFIICGIISLPVGVIGYFFNPDFPEITRAFYLTKADAEFARERLILDGYKPLGSSSWTRSKLFRIMKQWQFWVLPIGYFLVQSSFPDQQPFYALWLKAEGKTVYQRNVWPTGQPALGAVTQITAGMLSDSPLLRGKRWQAITAMQAVTFFGVIVLAVWNVPIGLHYAANYLAYACAGVPGIYYSWFPDLMPQDHEMRGFMIAVSNMFSYIMQIWYQDAAWGTAHSPRFHAGFIAAASTGAALVLLTLVIRFLEIRDTKKRERDAAGPSDVESHVRAPEESRKGGSSVSDLSSS